MTLDGELLRDTAATEEDFGYFAARAIQSNGAIDERAERWFPFEFNVTSA